jgi:16S rRNA (guanine966-N2)-methyltransferase
VRGAAAVDAGDRLVWLHTGTVRHVRVVGGVARGRQLRAPSGSLTRPTSDRVREAMFSMLDSMDVLDGASVVDLFAGSGALGIEALSRGAVKATFVDNDPAALGAVRSNLSVIGEGFAERSTVVRSDAVRFLANMPQCDVLLADPPYTFDSWPALLAAALPNVGLLVAETGAPLTPGDGWETVKVKTYGGTVVTVARRRPGEI